MQRDKQSSGERGLGPFSKDTSEMAQHVTEGMPLPCQATPAVCGQVYLTKRHINTPPDARTQIQHTQKPKHRDTYIYSIPSLPHAAFHVVP